jgi:tRNA-splicing ligase RtcB (3'-phosphate/5'-hydroxy nucleic acid ligase)
MKKVISENCKIPIKMWLDDIEEGAIKQAQNLANLPFAVKHIALMPDSHVGYGMPIGAVLATKGVVVPNAVGVDIGCGMCAQQTSLKEISVEKLKAVMSVIRAKIPLGFDHHTDRQDESLMPQGHEDLIVVKNQYLSALKQIGTLGGGNHFIEIQHGSDGHIWVMIHSGSRNLGLRVAEHYNKAAIKLNENYYSMVPKNWELAFLPVETQEAHLYMSEMKYCVEFALANRKLMMSRIMEAFHEVMGEIEIGELINKSHNFAAWEHHFGENVLVHRKGATRAYEGELGMIPGSMGTKSYIVRGLGNPESLMSCSHGAGRKMGRKQASRELNLDLEIERMNAQRIVHGLRGKNDLDEAPGAYKDIETVMGNQKDLVDIVVELKPLGGIKG